MTMKSTLDTIDSIDLDEYGEYRDRVGAYLATMRSHVTAVIDCGRKLGVSEDQLLVHDMSKLGDDELPGYAKHFPERHDPDSFSLSWLHHMHHNPHHWQYWMFPDGFTPQGSNVHCGAVEMPYNYILEMVADWMGSEIVHSGADDMTRWLKINLIKVILHPTSKKHLDAILNGIGYNVVETIGNPCEQGREPCKTEIFVTRI